jgi:hypothetical protein
VGLAGITLRRFPFGRIGVGLAGIALATAKLVETANNVPKMVVRIFIEVESMK